MMDRLNPSDIFKADARVVIKERDLDGASRTWEFYRIQPRCCWVPNCSWESKKEDRGKREADDLVRIGRFEYEARMNQKKEAEDHFRSLVATLEFGFKLLALLGWLWVRCSGVIGYFSHLIYPAHSAGCA